MWVPIVRLRRWLLEDKQSVDRDLPDLISILAATGCRIGEAAAELGDTGAAELLNDPVARDFLPIGGRPLVR
jgi:hypothetical protein